MHINPRSRYEYKTKIVRYIIIYKSVRHTS